MLVATVVFTTRSLLDDQSGQALPEFALLLPLLVVLLFGTIDLGTAVHHWLGATHIVSEGARFAAVDRAPYGAGTLQSQLVGQAAESLTGGDTSDVSVCVTYPEGNLAGKPVEVKLSFKYTFIPFIGEGIGVIEKSITSKATMQLEVPPTHIVQGCE